MFQKLRARRPATRAGGDLLDYVNQAPGGLAESEARYIFQQLVLAVDYCHRAGVVNRDIKPEARSRGTGLRSPRQQL